MIDHTTGIVSFEHPAVELGPRTTRDEFQSLDIFRDCRTAVDNEPWHSWFLPPMRAGLLFSVAVFFHGPRLSMIHMEDADDRFGKSWTDFSERNERARKASHDLWLQERCGLAPGTYPWGIVASVFMPRGDSTSCIIVRYELV